MRRFPVKEVGLAIEAYTQGKVSTITTVDYRPQLVQYADYMPLPTEVGELASRLPGLIITPGSGDFLTQSANGGWESATGASGLFWLNYLWKLPGISMVQGSEVLGQVAEMWMNTTESDQDEEQYQAINLEVNGCEMEFVIPSTWEFGDDYAPHGVGHWRIALIAAFVSG